MEIQRLFGVCCYSVYAVMNGLGLSYLWKEEEFCLLPLLFLLLWSCVANSDVR